MSKSKIPKEEIFSRKEIEVMIKLCEDNITSSQKHKDEAEFVEFKKWWQESIDYWTDSLEYWQFSLSQKEG